MPSTSASGLPSAISLMVKSNSLPATKSMASDASTDASGETATCAPTKPSRMPGFSAFRASATLTSAGKDGVLVCSTTSS
jgi:hypothetical protein